LEWKIGYKILSGRFMKICIITNLYYPNIVGGAEISTQSIAEGLKLKGYDVFVITLTYGDSFIEYVNGIKVYYLKLKNIYWPWGDFFLKSFLKPFWHLLDSYNFFMAKEVAKILDIEKPDVVKCSNLAGFSNGVWSEVKKRRIALIQVLRDSYNLCVKSTMFNGKENCKKQCGICKAYRLFNWELNRLVDGVVGVSSFILNLHLNNGLFLNSKSKVIYNGFKIGNNINSKSISNKIKFGFAGRISKHKGIELLLDVFSKLNYNGIELLIAGTGEQKYYNNLRNKYKNKENIKFMGFVKSENFYKLIDVIIVPSLWNEAFGRVIIEAMSYGIPVIGSSRGGIPEVIIDGENGFLFDPDKKDDLKLSINKFIKNKENYMKISTNCLKRVKDFSLEKMLDEYEKFINEIYNGYNR